MLPGELFSRTIPKQLKSVFFVRWVPRLRAFRLCISIGFQDVNDLLLICKSMVVVDNKTPLYRSHYVLNSSRLKATV